MIAVGAILRYAVTATVSGIELKTVGLILMILGVLVAFFVYVSSRGRRRSVGGREAHEEPPVY